jgi:hypothetical protein
MDLATSIKLTKENYEMKVEKYQKDTEDMEREFQERRRRNERLKVEMQEAKRLYEKQCSKMVDLTEVDNSNVKKNPSNVAAKLAQQEVINLCDDDDAELDQKPAAIPVRRTRRRLPPRIPPPVRRSSSVEGRRDGVGSPEAEAPAPTDTLQQNITVTNHHPASISTHYYRSFRDETSVGKTRHVLNQNEELLEIMGYSKFSQGAVRCLNGKVYALVLNDDWNELAKSRTEPQFWYVGMGAGRKKLATMVTNTAEGFPLFHAPMQKEKTKNIFYVGHYKVMRMEEIDPQPLPQKKPKENRQLLVTMHFVRFCRKLSGIIANE